jgi:hypothetical protein
MESFKCYPDGTADLFEMDGGEVAEWAQTASWTAIAETLRDHLERIQYSFQHIDLSSNLLDSRNFDAVTSIVWDLYMYGENMQIAQQKLMHRMDAAKSREGA